MLTTRGRRVVQAALTLGLFGLILGTSPWVVVPSLLVLVAGVATVAHDVKEEGKRDV